MSKYNIEGRVKDLYFRFQEIEADSVLTAAEVMKNLLHPEIQSKLRITCITQQNEY